MVKLRLAGLALVVLVAAVLVVGCGDSGDDSSSSGGGETTSSESGGGDGTVEVSLGDGITGTLPEGEANIALFMASVSNEWQKQVVKGAEETASKNGDSVEVYDAGFDPNEQLNQVQNALQQGNMDAALILPADSNLMCDVMTKQVADKGIPVVALAVPLCGHETDNGEESWNPGTLSYVGGNNTLAYTQAWFEAAAELNPGKQTVALVTGPELLGQTITTKAVLDKFQPENPEFDVKYFVDTNFTTPDVLAKVQTLLKANPDITRIMAVYSPDLTRGVVQALNLEGLAGKIPVIDEGASKYSYEQIEKGVIQMTVPYWPYNIGSEGSQAIKDAQEGKEVPKFIGEAETGDSEDPLVITKDNLGEFDPQY